jgi:hypothetical protein
MALYSRTVSAMSLLQVIASVAAVNSPLTTLVEVSLHEQYGKTRSTCLRTSWLSHTLADKSTRTCHNPRRLLEGMVPQLGYVPSNGSICVTQSILVSIPPPFTSLALNPVLFQLKDTIYSSATICSCDVVLLVFD